MPERLRSGSGPDRVNTPGSGGPVRVRVAGMPAPTIASRWSTGCCAGTTTMRATCRGDAPGSAPGRSWSASSCCSRPRWRGCWSRGGSWIDRWPTPPALAAAPAGEAVRAWGRLGYPRRALRLHRAAEAITEQHAGEVPTELRRSAGAARRRLLHGGGHRLVRVRAAACGAGHQRPPGAGPGRCRGRTLPPLAATAAETRLAAGVPAGRAGARRPLGGGVDGAGRAGLHRPYAVAASVAPSRTGAPGVGPVGPSVDRAAATSDVRGHRPPVPGRAAGRAAVERRDREPGRAGRRLAGRLATRPGPDLAGCRRAGGRRRRPRVRPARLTDGRDGRTRVEHRDHDTRSHPDPAARRHHPRPRARYLAAARSRRRRGGPDRHRGRLPARRHGRELPQRGRRRSGHPGLRHRPLRDLRHHQVQPGVAQRRRRTAGVRGQSRTARRGLHRPADGALAEPGPGSVLRRGPRVGGAAGRGIDQGHRRVQLQAGPPAPR